MSLYKLHSFLRENSQDVMDYWIDDDIIRYVRIVSRKNGFIFFVKLSDYKIKFTNTIEQLEKPNFFFIEASHKEHENLNHLYDVFLCAFPEHQYRYLLFDGYFMMQEKDICFHIKNMSNTNHFGFYLFIELEWFYENIYTLNHEIEKTMNNIQIKIETMYRGFLPNYCNFCNNKDIQKITNVWDYYRQNYMTYQSATRLYLDICGSENRTIHDIEFNEKISNSDDLMFQETVRRSHQKKILSDRLDRLIHLKTEVIKKLLFHHCIQWKILLKFMILISRFTKLESNFHSLVHDLELTIPKQKKIFER